MADKIVSVVYFVLSSDTFALDLDSVGGDFGAFAQLNAFLMMWWVQK